MLEFCVQWARRYIKDNQSAERIPLLIELRGQNPAEVDSLDFLSPWAGRYGIDPRQVYNLIKSGEAIVIFEGFDELRNAGRAYDRHEHFNALWLMSFPGTKLIFTGRPNFFLDEKEKNRTLRTDILTAAAGGAFTQLWEIDQLTEQEVGKVVRGFGEALGASIMKAAKAHAGFFQIISRPSMLPVVATIWGPIQKLQEEGRDLTSAFLLEQYLRATYQRKEQESKQNLAAFDPASYLLLPWQVRDVFTLAVVWKMACSDSRNTINRTSFDALIAQVYDEVLMLFQKDGVPTELTRSVLEFEAKFQEETKADKIERVSNAVASAGLFVSDPAGGPSNLRLPHKQFYEYVIAKASWIISAYPKSLTARTIHSVDRRNPMWPLCAEEQSLVFFSELIGSDFSVFRTSISIARLTASRLSIAFGRVLASLANKINFRTVDTERGDSIKFITDEQRFDWKEEGRLLTRHTIIIMQCATFTVMIAFMMTYVADVFGALPRGFVPAIVGTAVVPIGALFMVPIGALFMMMMTIFVTGQILGLRPSGGRLMALKRIVAIRLIAGGHVTSRKRSDRSTGVRY